MARRKGAGPGAVAPPHTPSPAKKHFQGLAAATWDTASSNNHSSSTSLSPSKQLVDPSGYADRQGGGGKRLNRGSTSSASVSTRGSDNMPKRGAEEYITKDHGTIKNAGAGEDKPTMSTAAQQARRKIAQPKSRLGRSTTPTSTGGFGQQAQSSPFSFPGASNTTSSFPPPPQQQSFNFAVPGAASSFTFGASNNTAQPASNPFANVNGGVNGGSLVSQNDAMMETSPQAQKTTNLFGATTSQPAPSTNGFSFNFGQSAQQPSEPTTAGFHFGQQKTQEQGSSTGLFGQSSASQPQINGFSFGQSTQTSAPSAFGAPTATSAPTFSFGSTSTTAPSSAPAPASTPLFKFGDTSAVTDAKPEETTVKPKPSFGFGQTSSFGKPADSVPESTQSKPAFSFGQPAGTTSQLEPAGAPPAKSGFMFGQTAGAPSSSQPESNSPFGSLSKPAETPSPSSSLFGRVSPADEASSANEGLKPAENPETADKSQAREDAGPKNPFASLFAGKSQSESASGSATTAKPLFNFGSPSKSEAPTTSNNLFSSKPLDSSSQIENTNRSGSTSQFQPNQSSGGLFSPKADAAPQKSNSPLNLNSPAAEVDKENSTAERPTSTSMFAPKPANYISNTNSTPFKFGQRHEEQDKSATSKRALEESAPPEKKKLFTGSSAASSMAKSAGVSFDSRVSSGPSEPVQPRLPEKSAAPPEILNRAVSTEGPPQIPRFLSADKYKSYDENWRLKGLNRRFKQMIARCDPDKHDFLNLVQNYLDHREATGAPGLVGLDRQKLDPVAGSKRKATDVNDMQDAAGQNKKVRPGPAPASNSGNPSQQRPAAEPSNFFASVASPKPSATFSPSKSSSDPTTSNLFKSMIPGATSISSDTTSTTPTFSIGNSSAPKSTTPPSSPPKSAAANISQQSSKPTVHDAVTGPAAPQLPKFEVPKFGGSAGTNFSNAFAQAAAANAKKFEKEAKEKRKAEEFDSDEDDEEAWNKKYEEEQRAKKAKIEAAAKNLSVPGFVASASSSRSNSPFNFGGAPATSIERSVSPAPLATTGSSKEAAISIESDGDQDSGSGSGESGNSGDDEQEQAPNDLAEDQVDDSDDEDHEEDEEGEPIPDIAPEQSLFSRIEKPIPAEKAEPAIFQPSVNHSFKPGIMFGSIGKGTPEAPSFSPLTPATAPKGDFVPAKTFNFTPTPTTAGASVFGSQLRDGPVPGEGLFGSRPTTPQPLSTSDSSKDTKSTSVFSAAKPVGAADNTWKVGSPIKFGSSTAEHKDDAAPSLEITAATPPAKEQPKPFAGLFGQSPASAATNGGTSLGFNFGNPSTSTTDKPAPGFLSAASYLKDGGLGSALSSGVSSRGSSPGILSEAESVVTDTEETYNDPQASFMSANAGEENEDILYESKAALSRMYKESELTDEDKEKRGLQAGWKKMGSGTNKILKDKETGKCRILFRAEPGANILLNTRLLAGAKYTSQQIGKNGAVTFPVAVEGGMQLWMIKVKTKDDSDRMARTMEENKAN